MKFLSRGRVLTQISLVGEGSRGIFVSNNDGEDDNSCLIVIQWPRYFNGTRRLIDPGKHAQNENYILIRRENITSDSRHITPITRKILNSEKR